MDVESAVLPFAAKVRREDAHEANEEYELTARRLEVRGKLRVVGGAVAALLCGHVDARQPVQPRALEDPRVLETRSERIV